MCVIGYITVGKLGIVNDLNVVSPTGHMLLTSILAVTRHLDVNGNL